MEKGKTNTLPFWFWLVKQIHSKLHSYNCLHQLQPACVLALPCVFWLFWDVVATSLLCLWFIVTVWFLVLTLTYVLTLHFIILEKLFN